MEHAKRTALKLFNYQFLNEQGHVKTANVLKYFAKVVNRKSSTPVNNLDIWKRMVDCWAIKVYNMRLYTYTRSELFNKNRILNYYRGSFEIFINDIMNTIKYRVPSEHAETNFDTIKFLYDDYKKFLHSIATDRLYKLDKHEVVTKEVEEKPFEVITKEVELPPEQTFEVFYPVEERIAPKKYTKPIQHFKEVLQYQKGQRGLRKVREYY